MVSLRIVGAGSRLLQLLPRNRIVATVLFLGFACSVALWLGALHAEQELLQSQFRSAASNRVLAVERELQSISVMVRATAAFIENSNLVTQRELESFLRPLAEDRGVPLAVRFESAGQELGYNPEGLVPHWFHGPPGAYLAACGTTGEQCLGIRLNWHGGVLDTMTPVEPVVERGLSYLAPTGIDIDLREGTAVRYRHASRLISGQKASTWKLLRPVPEPFLSTSHFEGLALSIECRATPGLLASGATWQPWGVLFGGLAATGLLALVVASILHRSEQVESLVHERTLELEHARDIAVRASMMKSRLVANVSHELRTPLNGVMGVTRLLLDTPMSTRQRELARTIQTSGRMLLGLINDLLDLARIEAGQFELRASEFSLGEMVQSVVDNVSVTAASKGLTLEVSADDGIPDGWHGDPVRISQILMNLMGNAVKFTERGGVWVTLSREGDFLDIAVRDTGPGIAPELASRIFERFVQGDESDVRPHGGTGLGLAISKELAQLMGGGIRLRHPSAGGSEFIATVPWQPAGDPTQMLALGGHRRAKAQPEQPEPAIGIGMRVLVAEDNPINQLVATGLLHRLGFAVDLVRNGIEAVEAAARVPFAAILMDCQMPEMDGFEATRQIRRNEREGHRTPILALTANASEQDRDRCLESGMDDLIAKPLEPALLVSTLERWCSKTKPAMGEIPSPASTVFE